MKSESTALALPDEATLRKDIQAINAFQVIVRNLMIEGHDYGVIPGTQKPALLKPGAEKIAKLLGLADQYDIIDTIKDWDKPLFAYEVKCRLVSVHSGTIISEGLGECNSMEANYRFRDSKRKCPYCDKEAIIKGKDEYGGGWLCFTKKGGCGAKLPIDDPLIMDQKIGQVLNDDIYSLVNTFLKMAKKRSLIDAALSAGRLSDLFTQDLEDIPGYQPLASGEVVNGHTGEITPRPTTQAPGSPAHGSSDDSGDPLDTTNPSPQVWSVFWRAARNSGYDKEMVHKALGIDSVKDNWLKDGKTLRQAIDLLLGLKDAAGQSVPGAEQDWKWL